MAGKNQWSKSWHEFVGVLEKHIYDGTLDEFSKTIGGESISWQGKIRKMDLQKSFPRVNVSMPEHTIRVDDVTQIVLKSVALPIASTSVSDWEKHSIGDTVRFLASFIDGNGAFNPVDLKTVEVTGKQVILVSLTDAIPQ